ncbi:sodium-independent anion transporter [Asanoa sp. WMMD1127]|uniref:sodium-independent anion transporter n=1 Tax=Asanoa sp. WMMD1127 TaxID=3016107 RepID=UPI002417579C|nr:sodium-independent anion transporter [Asanoa sp. WMMD1127]MDG4824929.1 sodium-independent anion transporter [Asanoa sp. WMMD1127]
MSLLVTTHRVPAPAMTIAITPQGEFRSPDAQLLRDRIIAVLAATHPEHIVVDLHAVPDIDEAGIDALRDGQKLAAAQHARLMLADPEPRVREKLERRGRAAALDE